MLKIDTPVIETFNESDNTFQTTPGITLSLEHSLVSVSKWESTWCVPFLSKTEKTHEQNLDYVRCMTLTQNVEDRIYGSLTASDFQAIDIYIDRPMTATTIKQTPGRGRGEIITAEIIYYWMITLNIPFECQKWHLNRLLMLINVCNAKQKPPKKMSKSALAQQNHALNAQRRAALGTSG